MEMLDARAEKRLKSENNIWVATVRSEGRPHLTPVWFAWHGGRVYISIDPKSVKARNLATNGQVALALEDGSSPVIFEGTARRVDGADRPRGALDEFKRKYDWNIDASDQYSLLIEITPHKVLIWSGGG